MWTFASFLFGMILVLTLTAVVVQRMDRSDDAIEEYFAGGRALAWPIVAGSLLLTNLSTEQLVGLNGAVFADGNLVGVAWEALAAIAMVITALVFLPRYLKGGFTTTTAFLEQRFDKQARLLVAALFLSGYVTVLLPVVLYTGGIAIQTLFDLTAPLWLIAAGIGVIGAATAIFGGLKTVAVSDTLNGIGLLIGGLAIPVLALGHLGDGSLLQGLATLYRQHPESLAVLATVSADGKAVSVPWPTLLTGMMFIQIFYWSTNQVIVQRALGARSLAAAQKGVLFAAAMKLLAPLILCLPGIIALHMVDDLGITAADQVYPALVRQVLPPSMLGLFAAVITGAILSSFNSALNSAATLFCLELYRGWWRPDARAERIVGIGKILTAVLAILAVILAPHLGRYPSVFAYLQQVNGLYSVPIVAVFLVGVFTRSIPAWSAKLGMLVGLLAYGGFTFVGPSSLHFLHGYFLSFLAAVGVMATGYRTTEAVSIETGSEAQQPWRHRRTVSAAILAGVFGSYLCLSVLAA